MPDPQAPFWRRKAMSEMTRAEWESLCDGCGRCCLNKLIDEDTNDTLFTDGFDGAGEVGSANGDLRCVAAEDGAVEQAGQAWFAAHDVPVAGVDAAGVHPHPDLARARVGDCRGHQAQDVG